MKPAKASPSASASPPFASCLPTSGYGGRLARWAALAPDDWLQDVNRLAARQALRSAGGLPLRFVFSRPGEPRLSALAYERRVHDEGLVSCRRDGGGFAHDRWNAAVWLRWPRTKAALNAIHVHDDLSGTTVSGQRSRVRDLATLLDESGLAWLSTRADCDALLRERQWQALFIDHRAALSDGVEPQVIGHGLLGKLDRPYKRLSAQVLIVPVEADVLASLRRPPRHQALRAVAGSGDSDAMATVPVEALAEDRADPALLADAAVATRIAEASGAAVVGAGGASTRRACLPLPVLALPGWCEANRSRSFFDDPLAFRGTRARSLL